MVAIDITKAKNGGLLKEIIKEGTGDESPVVGNQVSVHYIGTFLDGSIFDSSRERNEPFQFTLNNGSVITAWNIGVATMKKGEISLFTCAPEYAYGNIGNPPKIPKDSTLNFEIELLDWKGENISKDKDCTIEKFQITKGCGYVSPEEGAFVEIHLIGKYNNEIFEERDVKFLLGEGEDVGVVEGVEKALGSFRSYEKARLKIKSKYAFKEKGKPEYNIPPNADVEYIVELKMFENSLKLWVQDKMGKVEQSKILKEKGTKFFRKNKFTAAAKLYRSVLYSLLDTNNDEDDLRNERNSLELSARLNLALCYLKIDKNSKARDICNKVLKIDPNNEKALFRRGLAHLALASPEIAVKDFQEVLRVQPKNTAASKQIIVCNNLIKKQLAKEKKLYANMFDKFAEEDKQKEEEELRKQPDVMRGTLGEWGQEERPGGRDATAFEKENPNILMLNANGTGEFQNM